MMDVVPALHCSRYGFQYAIGISSLSSASHQDAGHRHPRLLVALQMTSPDGRQPNLLGHLTHDGYWKLVRKGVAPAFSPKNIRSAGQRLQHLLWLWWMLQHPLLAHVLTSNARASNPTYAGCDPLAIMPGLPTTPIVRPTVRSRTEHGRQPGLHLASQLITPDTWPAGASSRMCWSFQSSFQPSFHLRVAPSMSTLITCCSARALMSLGGLGLAPSLGPFRWANSARASVLQGAEIMQ
jgi:hypothetical protein